MFATTVLVLRRLGRSKDETFLIVKELCNLCIQYSAEPFDTACWFGHLDKVQFHLQSKFDSITSRLAHLTSPHTKLYRYPKFINELISYLHRPMNLAIQVGHLDIVKYLLSEKVNQDLFQQNKIVIDKDYMSLSYRFTWSHPYTDKYILQAIKYGQTEIVSFLSSPEAKKCIAYLKTYFSISQLSKKHI